MTSMRKRTNPERRSVKGACFLALICLVIMASDAQGHAGAVGQSSAGQSAAIIEKVRAGFGSAVEAVTVFSPFYLAGDFNGDGVGDIAVVVRVKGSRSTLSKD